MAIFETEYDSVWNEIYQKRKDLLDKRADLEAQLTDVNREIMHLNGALSHLATLAGIPEDQDISSMGITDAVRWVMSHEESRMSGTDVRDALSHKGYDLSSLTAPMSSIYKILSRLSSGDKPEITREKDSDGKVYYQWTKEESEASSDIPF